MNACRQSRPRHAALHTIRGQGLIIWDGCNEEGSESVLIRRCVVDSSFACIFRYPFPLHGRRWKPCSLYRHVLAKMDI